METNTTDLSAFGIVGKGISIGLKNSLSLIGAVVLWILTIWVPYINVGTTIGLIASVIAMSRGDIMSPLEIFNSRYRRYMGEFFLLMGIRQLGIFMGYLFFVIPGIVISIAWSMSIYLLIDKRLNPLEALKVSNDITYGHKWNIFFGYFILVMIYMLLFGLLMVLGSAIGFGLITILMILLVLLFVPVMLGATAHVYSVLGKKVA